MCPTQISAVEPLIVTQYPWQKVGVDLFEWIYLLVIDYYSRSIEITKLTATSANEVICHLKSIFARHGIPAELFTDNGPQFSANLFSTFSQSYGFTHKTSTEKSKEQSKA